MLIDRLFLAIVAKKPLIPSRTRQLSDVSRNPARLIPFQYIRLSRLVRIAPETAAGNNGLAVRVLHHERFPTRPPTHGAGNRPDTAAPNPQGSG